MCRITTMIIRGVKKKRDVVKSLEEVRYFSIANSKESFKFKVLRGRAKVCLQNALP